MGVIDCGPIQESERPRYVNTKYSLSILMSTKTPAEETSKLGTKIGLLIR